MTNEWWQSEEDFEWTKENHCYSGFNGSEDGCAPEMPYAPIIEPSIGLFWGQWEQDDVLDTMLFISRL